MGSNRQRQPISLSVQVITTLVVLIILASLAIGAPAIWFIRQQVDQLAWNLVNQANRTTLALLATRQSELANLAILTAQRPTLNALVEAENLSALDPYLDTLREGARLDLVVICRPDGQPPAQVGAAINGPVCSAPNGSSFFSPASSADPEGWLLAHEPLSTVTTHSVIVGQKIGVDLLNQLRDQAKVEQVFLIDDQVIAGTIPYSPPAWQETSPTSGLLPSSFDQVLQPGVFRLEGITYYAARADYAGTGLTTLVALPVTGLIAVQRNLTWLMGLGIAGVILLTSALGFVLAKRISQPLNQLRDAAIGLRKGNLGAPIPGNDKVREVAQVAYALEDARIALQHSLDQLRQEKAWGDHLLESVVEGILTLDRQDRITFFSRGAEQITGLEQDQVLRKPVDDVFQLQPGSERLSERLKRSGGTQEIVTVSTAGRKLTLAVTGAKLVPTKAGNATRALVLRDVTNEESIRRLLGDFLANITHEFRTPLTAQAVSIELLLDQLDELNTTELRELLTAHYLGVLNLQTLIDNLLEGASIEAGRFRVTPQPTELEEIVSKAVQTIRPILEKYGLRLQVEVPEDLPLVQADPRRTSQVLVNLLSNAIKWSAREGKIHLAAGAEAGNIKISVIDQGPGVPAEQKGDLFTWLPNLPAKNGRADHGAGLGLSVVRAIVEAQGGRVGVADGVERGAVFWFTIPIVSTSRAAQEPAA